MDFSSVKSIEIPEGNVVSIAIDGVVVWQLGEWIEPVVSGSDIKIVSVYNATQTDNKLEVI